MSSSNELSRYLQEELDPVLMQIVRSLTQLKPRGEQQIRETISRLALSTDPRPIMPAQNLPVTKCKQHLSDQTRS